MDNQDEDIFYFSSPPLHYDISESGSSCFSFDAPSFSPAMSTCSMSEVSFLSTEDQNDTEQDDEEPSITDHVNFSEMPLTLGEISATIKDSSATVRNTSDNISEPHTELPIMGQASPTTDEISAANDNVSADSIESMHTTEELPVAAQSCLNMQHFCESRTFQEQTSSDQYTDFSTSNWPGFKIVIDNIDKNLRPSFQRYDNKTVSMHACNMYASQDWINFSSLSDVNPAAPLIDVKKLLVGKAEIDGLNSDVVVLLSRYSMLQYVHNNYCFVKC